LAKPCFLAHAEPGSFATLFNRLNRHVAAAEASVQRRFRFACAFSLFAQRPDPQALDRATQISPQA
jgi:hypothetical protein